MSSVKEQSILAVSQEFADASRALYAFYATPIPLNTIIQCEQAVARCFRKVCDCFSPATRISCGEHVRSITAQARVDIQLHVLRNANWPDIRRASKELNPERCFATECARYVKTCPGVVLSDPKYWEMMISQAGVGLLSFEKRSDKCLWASIISAYHIALGNLGKILARKANRMCWYRVVMRVEGSLIPFTAYQLPKLGAQITVTQGQQLVYVTLMNLRANWEKLCQYNPTQWKDLSPKLCCIDPESVNQAFLAIMAMRQMEEGIESSKVFSALPRAVSKRESSMRAVTVMLWPSSTLPSTPIREDGDPLHQAALEFFRWHLPSQP